MAIRVKLGEYAAEETGGWGSRPWVLTGALVVVALVVVGRGSVAGLASATSDESVQTTVEAERPATPPSVFIQASWRTQAVSTTAAPERRTVYRAPVLLEEFVNPRVYANLEGVAICHVGSARDAGKADAVPAPFREAEVANASSTETTAE